MQIKLVCIILLASCVAFAHGNACNLGFGKFPNSDPQLYTLHARMGPVLVPEHMKLVFDFQVSPVQNIELTYVHITASLPEGCAISYPGKNQDIRKGFKISVSSYEPVTEMNGTADIYGINYGN